MHNNTIIKSKSIRLNLGEALGGKLMDREAWFTLWSLNFKNFLGLVWSGHYFVASFFLGGGGIAMFAAITTWATWVVPQTLALFF